MSEPEHTVRANKVRIEGNTNERTNCGKVKVYKDRLEIQQKGMLLSGGWITIDYSEVKSISQSMTGKLKIVTEANDYYVSAFGAPRVVEKMKEYVKDAKSQPQQVSTSDSGPDSVADELEKLADLKERGVLTEEEFEQQKNQLL